MNKDLPKLPKDLDDAFKDLPSEAKEWISEHPDVSEDEMALAWAWSGQADYKPVEIDQSKVDKMHAELVRESTPLKSVPSRRRLLSIAAAFLLLAGLASTYWYQSSHNVWKAPAGSTLSVSLPDGSKVELNSGSSLTYKNSGSESERRVELEGEAFFDVVHDTSPFIVETFNSETRVLGTSFNVRAWEDDPLAETIVVLKTGKVSLSSMNEVILSPGQMSRVRDMYASPASDIDLNSWLSWQTGGFSFDNQKVGSVLKELERRFEVNLEAPSSLQDKPITIFLNDVKSEDHVLESLCAAIACRYSKTESGYLIR